MYKRQGKRQVIPMNMNEENKTENPESGIQTYDRKKKSHGNFLKIGNFPESSTSARTRV